MKCLLKETKFKKLEFCRDNLGLDRYSGTEVMECLKKHKVEHCIECKDYPK